MHAISEPVSTGLPEARHAPRGKEGCLFCILRIRFDDAVLRSLLLLFLCAFLLFLLLLQPHRLAGELASPPDRRTIVEQDLHAPPINIHSPLTKVEKDSRKVWGS